MTAQNKQVSLSLNAPLEHLHIILTISQPKEMNQPITQTAKSITSWPRLKKESLGQHACTHAASVLPVQGRKGKASQSEGIRVWSKSTKNAELRGPTCPHQRICAAIYALLRAPMTWILDSFHTWPCIWPRPVTRQ
jgi:hypothetical protein